MDRNMVCKSVGTPPEWIRRILGKQRMPHKGAVVNERIRNIISMGLKFLKKPIRTILKD
jgi:hypothetical protein